MAMMPPEKLVIIDYCGTLSLDAPRFGRPENILRALGESGLAALGVSTPEAFWRDVVDPTWVEGSTTAIGYAQVIADRIASLDRAPSAPKGKLEAAASRFVAMYLDSSRIDPRWRPILSRLSAHPAVMTAIATDHYAEATSEIIGNLRSWGIHAKSILKGKQSLSPAATGEGVFFVANSADLGAWKEDRRFWEILRGRPELASIRRVLLIDDFGFNEAPGDSYGEQANVTARREMIAANLEKAFETGVEIAAFYLPEAEWKREEAGAGMIEKTAARIEAFLERRS